MTLPVPVSPMPSLAPSAPLDADARLIDLWLHGRPATTQRVYRMDAQRALSACAKPLASLTLADLQAYADSLGHLRPATRARMLSSIKSLLTFGHRLGLLPVNAGAALRLPAIKDTLAERILDEPDVQRMLALEPEPRDRALLTLLYAAGLRRSELCGLRWRDVRARKDGAQLTVLGKGGRTRAVLISAGAWKLLKPLGRGADPDAPVFVSRQGGPLSPSQVWRVVKRAALRAGIDPATSPHWLRHCHGSHALDRGAPISLVQATLGHSTVATTGRYLHAKPNESSGKYLPV